MAEKSIIYYDEAREFVRMEDCMEKVELAVSRLENPYNLSDENWVMYQDYLSKTAPKIVGEFIDSNRISAFPLLVKHRVIRKANVGKMVDYAQNARKMDILSYLLNVGNDFKMRPKTMNIAPKFTPGKSKNDARQKIPEYDKVKVGDIIWLGTVPMPWLVIEKKEGKIQVISKYAFDCMAYNNTFYKKRWEDCALGKWLNGEFFEAFFGEFEKEFIRDIYIDEQDVLHTEKPENSKGHKLFCLSVDEAKRFFRTSEERRARVTLQGKRRILWQSFDVYAHWWLRTPSVDVGSSGETHVRYDGEIAMHGGTIISNGYDEFYDHYGVRPAMYLDLE